MHPVYLILGVGVVVVVVGHVEGLEVAGGRGGGHHGRGHAHHHARVHHLHQRRLVVVVGGVVDIVLVRVHAVHSETEPSY